MLLVFVVAVLRALFLCLYVDFGEIREFRALHPCEIPGCAFEPFVTPQRVRAFSKFGGMFVCEPFNVLLGTELSDGNIYTTVFPVSSATPYLHFFFV